MKRFAGISVLAAKWIGTWKLSVRESKVAPIVAPGIPDGLALVSQTLTITAAAGKLKVAGDAVVSQLGSSHDEFEVSLDGKETETIAAPGATISTRFIDDSTFDVVVNLNNRVGEDRFVLSDDGRKLTETKIRTDREVVPAGTDPTRGRVIETAASIIVFYKVLDLR